MLGKFCTLAVFSHVVNMKYTQLSTKAQRLNFYPKSAWFQKRPFLKRQASHSLQCAVQCSAVQCSTVLCTAVQDSVASCRCFWPLPCLLSLPKAAITMTMVNSTPLCTLHTVLHCATIGMMVNMRRESASATYILCPQSTQTYIMYSLSFFIGHFLQR